MADVADRIYVGGREGFGYIAHSGSDNIYMPIDTVHRDIQKVVVNRKEVYYITETGLFNLNLDNLAQIDKLETNNLELLDLKNFIRYRFKSFLHPV